MVSGLTINQAKDLMNKYLSTPLPSDPGTWYGTLGGSPVAHSNCTLFSQWFLKNYTKGDVNLAIPSGYGFEMVDKFIGANGGKFSKSGTPQAFSLFSISPYNGTYSTYDAGHTGIVLGIDGGTVITGEANYGAPFGGLDARYPNNGTVVMTRPLSTFNSSTGVTFVHLETSLDGNSNESKEEKGDLKMFIAKCSGGDVNQYVKNGTFVLFNLSRGIYSVLNGQGQVDAVTEGHQMSNGTALTKTTMNNVVITNLINGSKLDYRG